MWIKNLRQRKLQTVMMFLIIAVCTTLLAGAMSILTSLEGPSRDFAKACNAITARVYPYMEDEAAIRTMGEQFSKLSNVKSVEYVKSYFVEENILFNGKKAEAFVDLTEYNDNIFGSDLFLEGNHNVGKTLADNECILPACISNQYDIHIGDTVIVQLVNGDAVYKVAAVYTDPYQTDTGFDSDLLVKKLPSVKANTNLFVRGNENVTGKQIEEAYRDKYNGIMNGFLYSVEDRIDNGLLLSRMTGAMFLAIGIIMLLVSALMIHYMIKNTMMTDAKSIAVYKTMGYTSNDILFMYLKLYFFIVTLACFVGIIGSIFFSNLTLTSIYENMGQLKANNSWQSGMICYLVIVSFVIMVITINITKAKRIKPVHSLNGNDYGGIKKKKHYQGNSTIQFSPIGIAYRTFMREKRNAVKIIITCLVTIFSVNFIVISLDVANTLKENNDYWIGIDKSDVMINVSEPDKYEMVRKTVEKDERTNYYLNSYFQDKVTMKWKKGMDTTSMDVFVYDDFNKAKLPVTEGRNPEASDEIAISITMSKKLNKNIGDYIEIFFNGGKKADMLITGFFQTYLQFGRACRMTTSAYTQQGITLGYNNISIYLKDKENTQSYINDMKDQIGGNGNVVKRTEQYGSIMTMIAKPQRNAIPPAAVMILLIAALNIFSIVYLKNIKTKKVNGIYKCIGYTTWHLILSNICYVMAIAVGSAAITLPISIFTYSSIMKISLSVLGFTQYPVQVNIAHLIIVNASIIVIFIISTLASSKALFKVNARDLVQE